MLPLAGSLWMIGQDYRAKLAVISSEQSGVRQLLALDALDGQLTAQRNLAAHAGKPLTSCTTAPAAKAAMDKVDANYPLLLQSLQTLGESLKAQHASADILAATWHCRPRSRAWTPIPAHRGLVAGRL